jgi:hypothetical protein
MAGESKKERLALNGNDKVNLDYTDEVTINGCRPGS